jgi:hypothetical protein
VALGGGGHPLAQEKGAGLARELREGGAEELDALLLVEAPTVEVPLDELVAEQREDAAAVEDSPAATPRSRAPRR